MARKKDKWQELRDFLTTAPKEVIAEVKHAATAAEIRFESWVFAGLNKAWAPKVKIILPKPPSIVDGGN